MMPMFLVILVFLVVFDTLAYTCSYYKLVLIHYECFKHFADWKSEVSKERSA